MEIAKFFLNIDGKILDTLERYCHKLQRRIGVSHFTWLKLDCLLIAFICFKVQQVSSGFKFFTMTLILFMAICAIVFGLSWWEERCLTRAAKGFKNPLRILPAAVFSRFAAYVNILIVTTSMIPLLILSLGLWGIIIVMTLLCFMVVMFAPLIFTACDPLPPTRGSLWEGLRKKFQPPAAVIR